METVGAGPRFRVHHKLSAGYGAQVDREVKLNLAENDGLLMTEVSIFRVVKAGVNGKR